MNELADAACAGLPVEVFFAHEEIRSSRRAASIEAAQRICVSCPVRQRCLDFAMTSERSFTRYGIWGGLTARERTTLSRRQVAA